MHIDAHDTMALRENVTFFIDTEDTVKVLKERCAQAFSYNTEDIAVCVGDTALEDARLSDTPIEAGCCVLIRRSNRRYVNALRSRAMNLAHLPEWVKDDPECVLAAVEGRRFAFRHASARLRADKSFALKVLKREGTSLRYTSEALQNDKDVVMTAVKQNGRALLHAGADLLNDSECAEAAICSYCDAFAVVGDALRHNKAFLLAAIRQAPGCFYHAPKELRDDRDCAEAAVLGDHSMIHFVGPPLLRDGRLGAVANVARRRESYLKHELCGA